MKRRKTKKRRKGRYHTGTHTSVKCRAKTLKYRSGWELAVATFFDKNKEVVEYSYEELAIPYVSNKRTGKIRNYYPDFLVTFVDGSRKLIEVKRKDRLSNVIVLKKAEAAKHWCQQQIDVVYEIWSNEIIEAIKKMNNPLKQKKPTRKKKAIY